MNLLFVFLTLLLQDGVIKEPFRIADVEPGHCQVRIQAAMAPDGRFAVAWIDTMPVELPALPKYDLYVRFFDRFGTPLTPAQKIAKLADTNWIYWPALAVDSAGNTVLLWVEAAHIYDPNKKIRFQRFGKDGEPIGSPTLVTTEFLSDVYPISLGCNNKGEFAVAWGKRLVTSLGMRIWVRRYSAGGIPQGVAYLVHEDFPEDYDTHFDYPQVNLSDAGDLVVTWLERVETTKSYPRFQVFDANDNSILPWEPYGHRLDDGADKYDGSRSEVHWLDNDRFVIFWVDIPYRWLVGRGFSNRGLIRNTIQNLVNESSDTVFAWGYSGGFSSAFSPDERFALTYTRAYKDTITIGGEFINRYLDHQAGVLGKIENDNPVITSQVFEYSPPYGLDTVWRTPQSYIKAQPPAVGVCNDRIVWVYSRLNKDTIWEAYALLTDWGVGVEEKPEVAHSSGFEAINPIGLQIILRYENMPEGLHASIYDATGRKVAEIHSKQTEGTIEWGKGMSPGVYFIVLRDSDNPALKVVLVR